MVLVGPHLPRNGDEMATSRQEIIFRSWYLLQYGETVLKAAPEYLSLLLQGHRANENSHWSDVGIKHHVAALARTGRGK